MLLDFYFEKKEINMGLLTILQNSLYEKYDFNY